MRINYPKPTLIFTLLFEGGKDDDPRDPGGRTNEGIIQREFSAYLARHGLPDRDVWTMTDGERDDIYSTYWNAVRGDVAPHGVDMVMFDGAVNSGPVQQNKWTQRALKAMGLYTDTVDGFIGNNTMAGLAALVSAALMIECVKNICAQRTSFLQALRTFATFGKGWMRRVTTLEADSTKLVYQRTGIAQDGPALDHALKDHEAGAKADAAASAKKTGGVAAGGAATGASTATPAPDSIPQIDPQTIRGLLIVGAIALIAAAVVYGYRWYKDTQRAAAFRNVSRT